MKIVKEWTTLELVEFLNSYRTVSKADKQRYFELMRAVRSELITRQPMIGMTYTL